MFNMKSRIKVTPLNSTITFLGFIDTYLLIPVIALYATSLGAGIGTVGLVVGVYSMTSSIMNIYGGRLIDRFGHKAPLIGGLLGDTLAVLSYSLCQLPWHLALVRAFHGISGGLVGPATMSISARYASSAAKGRSMSFYGIALGAATLVGFGAGGTIASRLGYHFLFYIAGGLLLIGVLLSLFIPSGKTTSNAENRPRGNNIKDLVGLITRGKLPISYLSIFAQYFAFGGVVVLLPLHVVKLGMSAFHVGILLAVFSLTFVIVQIPGGAISDRMGRLRPAVIGLSLCAVAPILLSVAQSFATIALVMSLYGAAFGVLFPSLSALLADSATPEEYGRATGIFHALITIGVAVGAPVIGWIASIGGITIGLAVSFVIFIPALVSIAITLQKEWSQPIAS